jgi:EAL domain-containing protein (putative c-di-GMP-specific phosphodiesterase class I)
VALPLSEAGLASVTLVDELLDLLDKSPMPGRLLHLVISADVVCNPDKNLQRGLQKLRQAGCRVIFSQVGRDMDVFHPPDRQYGRLSDAGCEVVSNVYGNLMDEMMVTIVQGHAQRLGMKTIAAPAISPS